jgi:hypothetical protein
MRTGTQPQRQPAGKDPVRRGQIRRSLPGAIQDQELMLEQKRLGNDGTGTARSEQASQGSDEMDEKDDQIAHHRILAGREISTNCGRNNNSPATGSGSAVTQGGIFDCRAFQLSSRVGKESRWCSGGVLAVVFWRLRRSFSSAQKRWVVVAPRMLTDIPYKRYFV